MAQNQAKLWAKYANSMKVKRAKKGFTAKGKDKGADANITGAASILEREEIVVQPLATEATGKAKKFERTGPQEFVSFLFEELTIDNVVAACNQRFKERLKGMTCEILASERGPSCSKLCQLPNLKLIHIRFVMASATDKYNALSDFDYETEAKTPGHLC